MIQSAHVGVGIFGKEGNQASSFADYAVPRFKDLRRLLFWHGRPFGGKLARTILIILFRGIFYGQCLFYMNLVNGFSGNNPLDTFMYATFNVNMTTLAVGFHTVLT